MTFVVVSSHEHATGKDLQQPGESVAVFAAKAPAQQRYAERLAAIAAAAQTLRAEDGEAGSTGWAVLLELPVPAVDVDEALETLEIIIEETDDVAGELGDLVLDYSGTVYAAGGDRPLAREQAIDNLQAWLT
ncbi:hypothetical protein [Dokdonella koreensis]|uniref:Uncharacterized protein n=1 Tax=Dokdonella koreensis DS-123 TaxID=1300342 RepID=A0A160DUE2_9GAMM|nr:hypothetical protein [Dokdonella koreensis]ANB17303.1 Hypothetical protein I596_1273 [Dokdonella koreensis DS-123]